MMKKLFTALALAALVSGCATNASTASKPEPATAKSAQAAISSAESALKKAGTVDGVWRDTGKFIKQAKKAATAKKYASAVKLANKAREQGEMGYKQAVSQKELRMPSYLKY